MASGSRVPPPLPSLAKLLTLLVTPLVLTCGGDSLAPGSVAPVVITSPTASAVIRTLGRQLQFTAQARDADGQVLADRDIAWRTSDPAAHISDAGLLTALLPGTVLVRATSGGVSSAPVTVSIDPMAVSLTLEADSLTFHTTGFALVQLQCRRLVLETKARTSGQHHLPPY